MLDIWREACCHIEIAEFASTISEILVHQMPIERIIIKHID
jgi:hypothetical protein